MGDSGVLFSDKRITLVFFSSLTLLIISSILSEFTPKDSRNWTLIILMLAGISSCLFFPLIVGYFMDKLRYEQEGDCIRRVFKEFSDGGIIWVYKDREESNYEDNAVSSLRKAFDEAKEGTIKLVGVSLRVFFNETSPFYGNIKSACARNIKICALINDVDCPEVKNRAKIESPHKPNDPAIKNDIRLTVSTIEDLNKLYNNVIEYKYYSFAPYCTLIIFPDKCYFSPNILSRHKPVRLPMIVFDKKAPAYDRLNEYFDYLYKN